jgi:CubicO group peptidase (beta-lactamase class C family)
MGTLPVRLVVSVLISLALAPSLPAAKSAQSAVDDILRSARLQSGSIPGAAVLVIRRERIVLERSHGVTDLISLRKIDTHTNFRLASVTKQFTAMGIMLLVHEGKLKYDDTLTRIFPDFPDYGRTIAIRNLLNHTSGLRDYEDLMSPTDPKLPVEQTQIQDAGVFELLKRQNSTKFPPGTKWEYSNSGYVLLGLIVQKVSGQTFPEFLHDRIFAPLDMSDTVAYVPGKNVVANRAFGHTFDRGTWRQTDQSPTSATLGDGGVYSSIADLAKWDRALHKATLLTADDMQDALRPVAVPGVVGPDNLPAQYGFGWFLNPYKGRRRMWHYGETIGFRTALERFTDGDLTVVVLCNRADLNAAALALQIADVYLERTAEP